MRLTGHHARVAHAAAALLLALLIAVHFVLVIAGRAAVGGVVFGWAVAVVAGYHLGYNLLLLHRRRDNAGQVPRLGNWGYSLARWAGLLVALFFLYHAVGAQTMGVAEHMSLAVLEVPGRWVYGVGLAATVLYVGRAIFSALIDLGMATRRAAARAAYVASGVLAAIGATASWQASHGL